MKYLKKEYFILACLILGIFAIMAHPTAAQITEDEGIHKSQQDIELSGTVVDQSTQEPITDAKVHLSKKDTMMADMEKDTTMEDRRPAMANGDTTTTGREGKFSFMMVKPGTHTVTVKASGYESWSQEVMLSSETQKPKQLTVELVPRR